LTCEYFIFVIATVSGCAFYNPNPGEYDVDASGRASIANPVPACTPPQSLLYRPKDWRYLTIDDIRRDETANKVSDYCQAQYDTYYYKFAQAQKKAAEDAQMAQQVQETERRNEAERERKEEEEKQKYNIRLEKHPECHNNITPFLFIALNPYKTEGRCYSLPILVITQWISSTTFMANDNSILVDMSNTPESGLMYDVWVIGEGAFQYDAVFGNVRTIPRVRALE
jgi:hypothetical protein